jgi:hypothetical protein
MENKEPITQKQFALFMFITLSQQAEGWAYFLKDNLRMESKMILNRYLAGAKSLMNHITDLYNFDDLVDHASVWSDLMRLMMELPIEKRELLYTGMLEFVNGNIKIEEQITPITPIEQQLSEPS